ncbi:hypothetical protein C4J81_04330 [Deltaproteobacteria bacterium Smac51]|nr:hypothetical protein C4J81_04330 [Deltaproteobacteria bacterium Smac51]
MAEESEIEAEIEISELEAGPRAERPNFLTATRFEDFDLPPEILEGLDSAGFEYCTPIQAQAIPVAMEGHDIAGQAQTGTGKTTAFLVPLLNRLLKNKPLEPGVPRAIIVTPTRELALQIHEDALVLAKNTSLKQVLVIGGMEYKEQADCLSAAPEIVICTPGRIIDYLQQGVFKTRGIEVAVVDEADRLLDMGFIKDLKYLLGKLPPFTHRQTMLFSATLDERVLELTYQYMNPPQYITAEPDKSTKVNIQQELYHIGRDEKFSLLLGLLRREEHQRIIIFSNTKSGVEWLAKKLTMNGFQAEGITGDLPQPKRLKLMEAFKENRLQILVATDVASRGIHVDDVSHVYNYDLPQDAENYVHRIGRTARAGNTGKAISFGCEDYVFHLEAIENLLGEKIPVVWAEQDWFQEDQGGEVRLKDRRGGDRDKRKGDRDRRGGGRGEAPRGTSRGPAKSQRPGGIFGLSPRLSGGNGQDAARQTLTWGVEEAPVIDAEIIEFTTVTEAAAAGESLEKESQNGRRRKRRRSRRGRDSNAEARGTTGGEAAVDAAPGEAPVSPEALVVEAVVTAATVESAAPEAEAPEKAARKPRRQRSKKSAPAEAEAVVEVAEAKVETAPKAEAKPAPVKAGKKKAAEKPEAEKDRYPKKRVSGKETIESEAVTPKAEEPPKYPGKRVKKADEKAEAASAKAEEKPKRSRASAKKAEDKAETTAEVKKTTAAQTPAKKTAAKKAEPVKAAKAEPAKKAAPKKAEKAAEEKPSRTVAKKSAAKDEAPEKKPASRAKSKSADSEAVVKKTAAKKSAADKAEPKTAKKTAEKETPARPAAGKTTAKSAAAKTKEAAPKKAPAAKAVKKAIPAAKEKEAKPAKKSRTTKKSASEND